MMKKTAFLMMAVIAGTMGTQAQTKPATKTAARPAVKATAKTPAKPVVTTALPVLKNSLDSFSYAVGMNIAASMKSQGITTVNGSIMQRAMNDVFNNKATIFTDEQAGMTLQTEMQKFAAHKSSAEKMKGEAFLAENKKKPGVITLPNGLQYEIITAGDANGIKPTAVDTVVVHYTGIVPGADLPFDSSVERGEPATFPVGGVIRGWTEILQLMTKGAKWKVAIPSDLAYGDRGAGGAIPPGAALVFDIELIDVKPAANN